MKQAGYKLTGSLSLIDILEMSGIFTRQQKYFIIFCCIILWVIMIGIFLCKYKKYKGSSYYKNTKISYFTLLTDKGKFGEYAIFKRLQYLEKENGRFLFNVYIPKEDTTTEIDVLLICPKGIIAFESKNYSGWIFGNEKSKNWTQVLPQGKGKSKKIQFLNPVIQNKGHIEYLKKYLETESDIKSAIVFSERCTLKEVTLNSQDIRVINRYDVKNTVKDIFEKQNNSVLSGEQIAEIYDKLFPLSQVDDCVKEQHIRNIRSTMGQIAVEEMTQTTESNVASDDRMIEKENRKSCPKCGGELILRTAKRGENAGKQFYGCLNYPQCRYVQNIENS